MRKYFKICSCLFLSLFLLCGCSTKKTVNLATAGTQTNSSITIRFFNSTQYALNELCLSTNGQQSWSENFAAKPVEAKNTLKVFYTPTSDSVKLFSVKISLAGFGEFEFNDIKLRHVNTISIYVSGDQAQLVYKDPKTKQLVSTEYDASITNALYESINGLVENIQYDGASEFSPAPVTETTDDETNGDENGENTGEDEENTDPENPYGQEETDPDNPYGSEENPDDPNAGTGDVDNPEQPDPGTGGQEDVPTNPEVTPEPDPGVVEPPVEQPVTDTQSVAETSLTE